MHRFSVQLNRRKILAVISLSALLSENVLERQAPVDGRAVRRGARRLTRFGADRSLLLAVLQRRYGRQLG